MNWHSACELIERLWELLKWIDDAFGPLFTIKELLISLIYILKNFVFKTEFSLPRISFLSKSVWYSFAASAAIDFIVILLSDLHISEVLVICLAVSLFAMLGGFFRDTDHFGAFGGALQGAALLCLLCEFVVISAVNFIGMSNFFELYLPYLPYLSVMAGSAWGANRLAGFQSIRRIEAKAYKIVIRLIKIAVFVAISSLILAFTAMFFSLSLAFYSPRQIVIVSCVITVLYYILRLRYLL